ncbi:MAG: OmpH family outer membrane protein [Alphaproteobacteria bacterium]|nr:OmpH family outer membrane protein [Alphaproteobacteria bacterium]
MIGSFDVRRAALAAVAISALLGWAMPARAVDKAPVANIVVVDFQNVLRQAVASKKVTDQLEKHRATFSEEIQKMENQLRQQEEELKQQRAVLAPEAFNQRVREWQERAAGVQQQVQTRKRQLDQAFSESMLKVREVLLQITAELATEAGANLVLPKHEIVFVDPKLDLSKEALARLDKKLPSVAVKIPAPAGPAAGQTKGGQQPTARQQPPARQQQQQAPAPKTN